MLSPTYESETKSHSFCCFRRTTRNLPFQVTNPLKKGKKKSKFITSHILYLYGYSFSSESVAFPDVFQEEM